PGMARRAVESIRPRKSSGSCASRRMGWRDAPVQEFKFINVTDNCASRSAHGAVRRYGKLCRFLHSIVLRTVTTLNFPYLFPLPTFISRISILKLYSSTTKHLNTPNHSKITSH
ncbi:hypothetical protein A2U01_0055683, partial [Trifolium medium]|nr:hypothetical protein [Trifolium medium]